MKTDEITSDGSRQQQGSKVMTPILKTKRARLLVFITATFALIAVSFVGYAKQINRVESEKAELARQAQQREWEAKTVPCPKCSKRFTPEDHKAPFLGAVAAGTTGGGAVGAAGGAWAGAGTGVAFGGAGAVPGYLIGAAVGGLGGGIVGGVGAAWYRDRQLMCPDCGKIFKNPKN